MSLSRKTTAIYASLLPPPLLFAATGESGLIGHWSPGIGDPTVIGWITVVAYFAAVYCCTVAFRILAKAAGDLKRRRRERTVWCILAVALALLGVNKQLDLQTAFTEIGRMLAKGEGWYDYRQVVQGLFIVTMGLIGFIALCVLMYMTRTLSPWTKIAVAGSVLIVAFVMIRAASFHHFDAFIQLRVLSLRMNWILELGGIGIILAGALLRRRELKRAASNGSPAGPPAPPTAAPSA
jgi:hypothetical protein